MGNEKQKGRKRENAAKEKMNEKERNKETKKQI